MNTWLTFIGKNQYSMDSFAQEARQFGISRNIPIKTLKGMSVGDTIYVFMKDTNKRSFLFGSFRISGVTGEIPDKVIEKFQDEGKIEKSDEGGSALFVQRACGSYTAGSGYIIKDCSIAEIVEAVEKENPKARLMVSGTNFQRQQPIPSVIPVYRRFRPFDYERFITEWKEIKGNARPIVKNYCYGRRSEDVMAVNEKGELVTIKNYVKK